MGNLKLVDMNPEVKNGVLMFDCPCGKHRMRVPIQEDRKLPNGVWWIMIGS